jgi:ribosome-binding factor A
MDDEICPICRQPVEEGQPYFEVKTSMGLRELAGYIRENLAESIKVERAPAIHFLN